uniref:Uncharacterized protein n=1 Tax=Magnetococcus massalia (strain MO-1) TaxID=451514 RepID=A0A1S7LIX5_MAGMO|nr:Protein of unknown function [Candidatus Magnetococcus massalia]
MSEHADKDLETLCTELKEQGSVDQERLNAIKALILEDGEIDEAESKLLRDMIYSTWTEDSKEQVSRWEVEFLFDLNEGIEVEKRPGSWQELFIDATTSHVMSDQESEGVIDAEETAWLIDMIEKDDIYDPNEIALLQHLLKTAQDIPMDLKFRLGIILSL